MKAAETLNLTATVPVGLLPVLIFLVVLVWMDSYKLVRLRTVLAVITVGGSDGMGRDVPQWLADPSAGHGSCVPIPATSRRWSRRASRRSSIIYLFRSSRIGFLVDAAIMGFAVGAGFALVENLFYLYTLGSANMAVWVVRGFGTAIMHGGVAAIFAIISQTLTERQMKINPLYYLPGLAVAALLHSIFNHFLVAPVLQAAGTLRDSAAAAAPGFSAQRPGHARVAGTGLRRRRAIDRHDHLR